MSKGVLRLKEQDGHYELRRIASARENAQGAREDARMPLKPCAAYPFIGVPSLLYIILLYYIIENAYQAFITAPEG